MSNQHANSNATRIAQRTAPEYITADKITAASGTLQDHVDDYVRRAAKAQLPQPVPATQHAALNDRER